MQLEAWSCSVRLAGWTQGGGGVQRVGRGASELVSFQSRSPWPATAALWVSFRLFCSTAPGGPQEDCGKSSSCQRRSGRERVLPLAVCVCICVCVSLLWFEPARFPSPCLHLRKKKKIIWFDLGPMFFFPDTCKLKVKIKMNFILPVSGKFVLGLFSHATGR